MRDRQADRLYRRFREQGDVAALGALFDHTATELLRVAAHLVRDVHAAEDLVQETYLAAIRSRETFDASRGVKPWLFGILVRQAALHHRRRSRNVGEPQDVHATADDGPVHAAEERELSAELERAVRLLPPLYRDVVERHLRLDQGSLEIAQALERAPGTVRVQIHRGLEMLRKALPAGFAASCAAAPERGRGLLSVREAVLEQAASSPVALSTSVGLLGAAAASKLVVSLVLAIAIGTVAWIASTPESGATLASDADDGEALAGTMLSRSGDPMEDVQPPPRASAAPSPALDAAQHPAVSAASPPAVWILRGSITSEVSNTVASTDVSVRAIGGGVVWPESLVVRGQPAADGRLEMDLSPLFASNPHLKPAELIVRADHPDSVPVEVRIDVPAERREPPSAAQDQWEFRADFKLTRAVALSGRVRDDAGHPIHDAEVALLTLEGGEPKIPPVDLVRSGENGSFRLRSAHRGMYALVALRESMRPATQLVTIERGGTGELVVLELTRGAHISGRVQPRGLLVQSGLRIYATRRVTGDASFRVGSDQLIWNERDGFARHRVACTTRPDGTFVVFGLTAGRYELSCMGSSDDPAISYQSLAVEAPADGIEFELAWSRTIFEIASGRAPLSSALVSIRPAWLQAGAHGRWVGKDGRLDVLLDAGKPYSIEVRAEGYRSEMRELLAPGPGEEVTLPIDLVRESSALAITLVTPSGEHFTSAAVSFGLLEEPAELEAARTGSRWWPASILTGADFTRDVPVEDGVLTLHDLPPGLFEVRIEPDSRVRTQECRWFHAPLVVHLTPGETLSQTVSLVHAGRVRVQVSDSRGIAKQCGFELQDDTRQRVPLRFVTRLAAGSRFDHVWFLGDAGQLAPALSDPALPPGNYTLVLVPEGGTRQAHPVRIEAGQITSLDLVLLDD